MPTYEYVCTECGEPLEIVQSIHDPSLTECPVCGGRLRKVFGNVGVVFKGSGFYKTDSRSNTKKTPAGSGGAAKPAEKSETKAESKADSGSSSSTSSDSKPASTPKPSSD